MSDKSSHQSLTRRALGLLWRSLVVGLGYTVAIMIGGMITQVLGLPAPSLPAGVDPTQMLLIMALSGVLVGLTLGPLAKRLTLPMLHRFGVLFLLLFVLNNLINTIEALFFTTMPIVEQITGLVDSGVGHVGLALLLAVLFRPPSVERGFLTALRETLSQRRWISWTWRILVAGVLYVPIYLFFGMLIAPIVTPYYVEMDMGLRVPGFEVMLPLEAFRGLLYVLTLFPLVAVLRGSRWSLAFWIVLTLCVLGSWQPMLSVAWWPVILRVTHGLEITADSVVHGLVIALLLWTPVPGRRVEGDNS
jgi:hypothetical protein